MPSIPSPLSDEQRQRVCALLALGSTRRMAAEFVGCRVLDLAAEIKRDPAFKLLVEQHELRPELEVLRAILAAARDPKQWRAGAWVLERFYPRRYSRRKADALPRATLHSALAKVEQRLVAALSDRKHWRRLFSPGRRNRPPRAKTVPVQEP